MSETYSPAEVAKILNVSPFTVRRYGDRYADHLSPTASPGKGKSRRFTREDVAVISQALQLAGEGISTEEVSTALNTVDVSSMEVLAPIKETPTVAAVDLSPVVASIDRLSDRLAAMASNSSPAVPPEVIEALLSIVETLQTSRDQDNTEALNPRLDTVLTKNEALGQRIDQLEDKQLDTRRLVAVALVLGIVLGAILVLVVAVTVAGMVR